MATTDPAYRYAMAKFPATGSQIDFNVKFDGGWLNNANVVALSYVTADYSDQRDEPATVIAVLPDGTGGTVRVSPAVPVGRTVVIYRITQRGAPLVDFINRSMLTELNLNTITKQAIYSVAELSDTFREFELKVGTRADNAVEQSAQALATANAANTTAGSALARANQAYDKGVAAEAGIAAATTAANNATTAANAATQAASDATMLVGSIQGTVQQAVDTANAASATAQQASDVALGLGQQIADANTKADNAVSQVAGATATANAAKATADGVDAKATQAQTDAATALSTVGNKLDKVAGAAQVVNSTTRFNQSLTAGGELVTEYSMTLHRDNSGTSFDAFGFWNTAGTVKYGKLFVSTDGLSFNAEPGGTGKPGASVAILYNGTVVLAGARTVNQGTFTAQDTTMQYVGAPGVQSIQRRIGSNNSVQRWAEVLEIGGELSYWSYDTSGGTAKRMMTINSTNTTGGQADRLDVFGQVRGNSNYANAAAIKSAGVASVGAYAAVAWFNTNDGRTRTMYLDGGNTMHYEANTDFMLSQANAGGFSHAGGFQVLSDERTKYALKPVVVDWDKFMAVTPKTGKYRKEFSGDTRKRLFLTSQNLEPHYPCMVKEPTKWGSLPDVRAVDYDQGVPLLWAMIQDLRREIVALKEQLK